MCATPDDFEAYWEADREEVKELTNYEKSINQHLQASAGIYEIIRKDNPQLARELLVSSSRLALVQLDYGRRFGLVEEVHPIVCPTCRTQLTEVEDVNFLNEIGECVECDHSRGDMLAEQSEG